MKARKMNFKGSITALITPFTDVGVDERAFSALVERQVAAGTHGLVPCGTTGETPTLSTAERKRLIEMTVEGAAGKIPVISGCGTNSTEETIHLAKQAEAAGSDALLVVTPYYNKPSQEGLFLHYQAVAASTGLPIIIYNIPGRTAVDMSVETMARLFKACKNIVGVKDATGDLNRIGEQKKALGDDFIQLSGDDITALECNQRGGIGCVSVTGNVAPGLCAEFQNLCGAGDLEGAKAIHERLTPLHKHLFVETNPVPVKYAMSLLGLCDARVRLPLAPLSAASEKIVQGAMADAGLLDA